MLLNKWKTDIAKTRLRESIAVKEQILNDEVLTGEICRLAEDISITIYNGGKLLICGNGGSASDALHIAGELAGRFQMERKGYAAIALNSDVAVMTAVANDYGYEWVFARQVEALLKPKDILLGISTSGNSENIIKAFDKAHEMGGNTALLSGRDGGMLKSMADYRIIVPSDNTARIQESHMCVYHIICEIVEMKLCEMTGR